LERVKNQNLQIFAKLVMEGQINSAMRFLSEEGNGGVLPLSDDVMLQLRQKHPEAEEAKIGTLLRGPVQEVIESLFIPINGQMVRGRKVLEGLPGLMLMDSRGYLLVNPSKNPPPPFVKP
jgi:hypothetical protein